MMAGRRLSSLADLLLGRAPVMQYEAPLETAAERTLELMLRPYQLKELAPTIRWYRTRPCCMCL